MKALPIPEIYPFASATSEQALKQWGFAHGVLYVKALIQRGLDAQQNPAMDVKLPG